MNATSIPRARRHLKRVGLGGVVSTSYAMTFRGRRLGPDSMCEVTERLRRFRHYAAEQCVDALLRADIRDRITPSPLILADSLSDLIGRMRCDGDPVATAISVALADGRRVSRDLPGNHYAYREKAGAISYTPKGRALVISESGRWERAGRQETTPARFARAVLLPSTVARLGDAALGKFAERFRAAEQADEITLEVIPCDADAVNAAYQEVAYDYTGRTLSDLPLSCMKDDPVGEFYAHAGAEMLVAKNGRGLRARAIIWASEGARYLDRVYAVTEADREAMLSHALAQGWWVKKRQNNHCDQFLDRDGNERIGLTVHCPRGLMEIEYIPYLDTVYWTSSDTLSTDEEDATHQCRNQNGTADEAQPRDHVRIDGEWVHEDDAVTTADGDLIRRDDAVYCECDGEYYADGDDRVITTHSGDTILTENAYRVCVGRCIYIVHSDDVEALG